MMKGATELSQTAVGKRQDASYKDAIEGYAEYATKDGVSCKEGSKKMRER